VKLSHHHIHRPDASSQLAAALGVEKVYFVDERLWYLRLTGCCRLSWRREAASVVTVFALGIALGFLAAHL
jgi:hypothetical protein